MPRSSPASPDGDSDQILAKPLPGARYLVLAGVVLLHVVAFALVANLRIFQAAPRPETDSTRFQMIKITPPAVVPPPPPPTEMMPSLAGGGAPAPAMAPIVITSPQAHFTVPMPDINGPGTALALLHALPGNGSGGTAGSGNGQGNGQGNGNGDGEIADICGLKISTNENVVVFENVWESNHLNFSKSAREEVLRYAERCISKYFFGTTPIQLDGGLIYHNPENKNSFQLSGDFYKAAYPMEAAGPDGKAPTVMLFISTWAGCTDATMPDDQDRELAAKAAEVFIASLRAHHIKLYLLSTQFQPYPALVAYAKESGGQVSITPEPPIQNTQNTK